MRTAVLAVVAAAMSLPASASTLSRISDDVLLAASRPTLRVKSMNADAQRNRDETKPLTKDSIEGSLASVPEPASMVLLGAGLLGIGFLARRRKI